MLKPATFEHSVPLGGKYTVQVGLMQMAAHATTFDLGAEAKLSITSGTIWVYDADQEVTGAVDLATSTTVKDASLAASADNLWKYLVLRFTSGTQLRDREWFITSAGSDGTLTLDVAGVPLPVTPAVGDTFALPGRALLGPTAMTVGSGIAYYQVGPANGITTTKGRKVCRCLLTYTTASGHVDGGEAVWIFHVTD